jgi:hypothetical protein
LERRAGNAFMGDSKTSLVNTRIAQVDAPESALRLYRRLVDRQAIEARLRDDVPYSLGLVFPVRNDFAGFDEVIDWRFRRLICGVEIHATGHEWRSENGAPNLVKDGKTYGNLFYNYEGGFEMTCPACQHSANLDDDIEIIKRAVTAWNDEPDAVSMTCPACGRTSFLRDWRSTSNTFAAGHLGFTLWGAHATAFVEKPPVAAATNIRHLIGDFAEDYAVVFCHI